jgi:predicted RNA-binding protein YlxR (DUF448 family)/ribosomal protein L7Ae-like RNA K-turn-binding protein
MAPAPNDALDAPLEDDPHTGPLRRCLVTRESFSRETMLRFVLGPDQAIVFDAAATLPGRGMWLSASGVVIQSAVKRGVFARAAKARVTVAPELCDVITGRLRARLFDLLGLARRSGAAVAGFEKAGELLASGKAGVILQACDGSAAERARFLGAREVPVVTDISAARLGQVFGREHVVHVAVAAGRLARMIEIEAARLAGVAGETASGQLGPQVAEQAAIS